MRINFHLGLLCLLLGCAGSPVSSAVMDMTVTVAWDEVAGVDGYVLYTGNQSGNYSLRAIEDTNQVTFAWSSHQQLFAAVTSYLDQPEIICRTFSGTNICVTNALTESAYSSEIFFMPSNALPFLSVSNGLVYLIGFGWLGTNYTVLASGNLVSWTAVATNAGTNAPWFYSEAPGPGSRFFKTLIQ